MFLELWGCGLGSGISNPGFLVLQFYSPIRKSFSIAISIHLFKSPYCNSIFRLLTIDLLLVIIGALIGLLLVYQAVNIF